MAKGGNTVDAVRKIAEPIAQQLGLEIWDVRYVKEGSQWYLRIFIDKEGGVSIDDCVDMTHAINKPLDEADPIEQAYCLEVSSPGIERELVRDEHFEKSLGEKVMIKTIRPIENQRDFKGILEGYKDGVITIKSEETEVSFNKKELSWIKLDDFEQ
ncbi:MAG: ribosome maturation factor RimP [Clostridia bacterium]|nr:ribosome maturation factor RimP [Clostridia bacterium]